MARECLSLSVVTLLDMGFESHNHGPFVLVNPVAILELVFRYLITDLMVPQGAMFALDHLLLYDCLSVGNSHPINIIFSTGATLSCQLEVMHTEVDQVALLDSFLSSLFYFKLAYDLLAPSCLGLLVRPCFKAALFV